MQWLIFPWVWFWTLRLRITFVQIVEWLNLQIEVAQGKGDRQEKVAEETKKLVWPSTLFHELSISFNVCFFSQKKQQLFFLSCFFFHDLHWCPSLVFFLLLLLRFYYFQSGWKRMLELISTIKENLWCPFSRLPLLLPQLLEFTEQSIQTHLTVLPLLPCSFSLLDPIFLMFFSLNKINTFFWSLWKVTMFFNFTCLLLLFFLSASLVQNKLWHFYNRLDHVCW